MNKTKIEKLELLSDTKFLKFYEAKYKNKLGNDRTWTIASRKDKSTLDKRYFENAEDSSDAVVIAALHKPSNKLVIVKQFRVPINDYIYELTAGLIDDGEEAEVAVKRELKEETGLILKDIKSEKKNLYLSPGMTDESVNLCFCTCEGEISDQYLEDDETIEAMLISREEAKEILQSGAKMDIKCYLVLQNFSIYGEDLFK